jgi:hypothetical protein
MSGSLKVSSKTIAGLALVALLGGCATETQRPRQSASVPAAAPAARNVEAEAMAFESFMRKGRDIDPGFANASQVSTALQAGAAHEPRQLESGMVAYAAMAALQEPAFVEGVRRQGRSADVARRLSADPSFVLQLPGANAAAGRASAALLRQGEALSSNGKRVKRAAYTVQHQAWSKTKVAAPARRLAEVKRISATGYRPESGDAARLRSAVAETGRRGGGASPVVTRGVALAALSVLGEADRGRALMRDPVSATCLRMAKLNLYQCLASSGPQYEDIYCLGQHAMIDPGQCVADAVAEPRPRIAKASYRR